jgi:hypothetical protein
MLAFILETLRKGAVSVLGTRTLANEIDIVVVPNWRLRTHLSLLTVAVPSHELGYYFSHTFIIPQDQINCCMFTLHTTGGSNELVGCAQNNCHNFELDSLVLSIAGGLTQGVPEYLRLAPIGYDLTPTPVMHTSGI